VPESPLRGDLFLRLAQARLARQQPREGAPIDGDRDAVRPRADRRCAGTRFEERDGTLLDVLARDDTLYGTFDARMHIARRSNRLSGQPVACAGDMTVEQGGLIEVDNASGHHKPPPEALDHVVAHLRSMGVDLSASKFNYFGRPDRVPAPGSGHTPRERLVAGLTPPSTTRSPVGPRSPCSPRSATPPDGHGGAC